MFFYAWVFMCRKISRERQRNLLNYENKVQLSTSETLDDQGSEELSVDDPTPSTSN
jgi:hypothetical protein